MTKISFYLLPAAQNEARLRFACRLAEKAFREGHGVYLHTDSDAQQAELDEMMWQFKPQSFLPHELLPQQTTETGVLIGQGDPGLLHDVMINLAMDIPTFFSRFERVSEIVIEDDAMKAAKRENFRFYRERGYPSETHQISSLR